MWQFVGMRGNPFLVGAAVSLQLHNVCSLHEICQLPRQVYLVRVVAATGGSQFAGDVRPKALIADRRDANLSFGMAPRQTWMLVSNKTRHGTAVSGSSPQPEAPLPGLGQTSSDRHDIHSPNHQNFDYGRPENYAQIEASGEFRSGKEDTQLTGVSPHSSANVSNSPTILQSRDGFFNTQFSPNSRFHLDDQDARNRTHITIHRDLSEFCRQSPSSNGNLGHVAADVQESCLLRYFIEELSPWFDHCDDRRQFQLVVPRRAAQCLALKNAVFAVSSRHLSRLPQYMTPRGIVYRGQALPNLKHTTSLEYMLKCIPELIQFPEIQDPRHQENIMAATVILRQYEEMEEETEESDEKSHANDRVNFLAITQTIIDTMISTPIHHSLAAAAHWIAIRQEVYYAFTRQRCPQFRLGAEHWQTTSVANTMIVFASQVARWRWGMKKAEEWEPLKMQHQHLSQEFRSELEPLLEQKPDGAKGEIFPTIWYCYDSQVTAIQHLKLSEMILIAESPHLENARGAVHRKAEAQVRSIVLSICGIALHHPRCQPAMVNAVISITLYGGYFTRPEDRDALLGIIHQTMELHSWPMRKPCQQLLDQWEMVDNAEL
ncbi:uncharacterized protein N7446_007497 [Penicillium canescens]|uniref:Uncharacterized protein n=1 Tax=Penicillium canescens TaxID=5083 RepID=A0AAD6ILN8_PENCN|nr:uncharacterized protein N7446_007497 [Penicillium canescens]KAJ6052852.1 hypothetical protein N7460_003386 [Penicillium canescens]KAJ6063377.1 hypothetical protein N7446_007497 [Penicillium canescens]